MDFEALVDMASESTGPAPETIPVLSVLDTKCDPAAYYRVDGSGLWRAAADSGGITLTRLFSGEELRVDIPGWRAATARGRIRQVAS